MTAFHFTLALGQALLYLAVLATAVLAVHLTGEDLAAFLTAPRAWRAEWW